MGSTARGWPAAAVLDCQREHTERAPGRGSLSWAVLTPAPRSEGGTFQIFLKRAIGKGHPCSLVETD